MKKTITTLIASLVFVAAESQINVATNFNVEAPLPVDTRDTASTLSNRDAIPEIKRYEGMTVYCLEDGNTWQLRGGTENDDWYQLNESKPMALDTTQVVHLSKTGSDETGDGSESNPYETIGGLYEKTSLSKTGVRIMLESGDWNFDEMYPFLMDIPFSIEGSYEYRATLENTTKMGDHIHKFETDNDLDTILDFDTCSYYFSNPNGVFLFPIYKISDTSFIGHNIVGEGDKDIYKRTTNLIFNRKNYEFSKKAEFDYLVINRNTGDSLLEFTGPGYISIQNSLMLTETLFERKSKVYFRFNSFIYSYNHDNNGPLVLNDCMGSAIGCLFANIGSSSEIEAIDLYNKNSVLFCSSNLFHNFKTAHHHNFGSMTVGQNNYFFDVDNLVNSDEGGLANITSDATCNFYMDGNTDYVFLEEVAPGDNYDKRYINLNSVNYINEDSISSKTNRKDGLVLPEYDYYLSVDVVPDTTKFYNTLKTHNTVHDSIFLGKYGLYPQYGNYEEIFGSDFDDATGWTGATGNISGGYWSGSGTTMYKILYSEDLNGVIESGETVRVLIEIETCPDAVLQTAFYHSGGSSASGIWNLEDSCSNGNSYTMNFTVTNNSSPLELVAEVNSSVPWSIDGIYVTNTTMTDIDALTVDGSLNTGVNNVHANEFVGSMNYDSLYNKPDLVQDSSYNWTISNNTVDSLFMFDTVNVYSSVVEYVALRGGNVESGSIRATSYNGNAYEGDNVFIGSDVGMTFDAKLDDEGNLVLEVTTTDTGDDVTFNYKLTNKIYR